MKIKIKFFGPYAYIVGAKETEFIYAEETLALYELLNRIAQRWSKFSAFVGDLNQPLELERKFTLIVNGEIVPLSTQIRDGDEVQILSPISGG